MKVLKFGGSSVANAANIRRVKSIVERSPDNRFVVVSAMGGVTDMLLAACRKAKNGDPDYAALLAKIKEQHLNAAQTLVNPQQQARVAGALTALLSELGDYLRNIMQQRELTPQHQDYALSFGERMSSYLICEALAHCNDADSNITDTRNSLIINELRVIDARRFIKTDSRFGNATVDYEATYRLCAAELLPTTGRVIIPGFIASNADGDTTTLGRGGSDYTAALVAAAVSADSVEIWTDTDGFMTADPRKVEKAYTIDKMTYAECFELSNFGAKVVYPPTVYPLYAKRIPMYIKNTFNPSSAGTLVNNDKTEAALHVKSVSAIDDVVLFTLRGAGMAADIAPRLLAALTEAQVNVIALSQETSGQAISFATMPDDEKTTQLVVNQSLSNEIGQGNIEVKVERRLSIVAIVGENIHAAPSVSARLRATLDTHGIGVVAITQSASALNISATINQTDLHRAVNLIHDAFFLSE
jgi:aspartokinase/homoserine dehydrogenase 1